jgi:hypothetical protein
LYKLIAQHVERPARFEIGKMAARLLLRVAIVNFVRGVVCGLAVAALIYMITEYMV